MTASSELRAELDRLTDPPDGLNKLSRDDEWDAWFTEQIRNIAALAKIFPHNIRLHKRASPTERRILPAPVESLKTAYTSFGPLTQTATP